jgi:hypothetical protein
MFYFIFQLLTIYVYLAIPCFAGWIANGGKREDVNTPIIGSILFAGIFSMIFFFTY